MAAVDAGHPALAEHERIADGLDVFRRQVLVVFAIEEDMGEYSEAVLGPTQSTVVSTGTISVAHEAAPALGRRKDFGAYDVFSGLGQGAEGAISIEDLEQ